MAIDADTIIEHFNNSKDDIREKYKNIVPDGTLLSSVNLRKLGYNLYRGKWFNPHLKITNDTEAELFYKLAILDNMDNSNLLARLIYVRDKKNQIELRNLKEDEFDRGDFHIGYVEKPKGKKAKVIRFMGTQIGSAKYSADLSEKYRESNKEFLRVLHAGPNNVSIRCHHTGVNLEGISRYSHTKQLSVVVDSYEMHHAQFINSSSYFYDTDTGITVRKQRELSDLVNSKNYKNYNTREISEFLGIILLSVSEHAVLHKLETSDGIDRWLLRHKTGDIHTLPPHWLSEENYKRLINWIADNCKMVNVSILLSYEEFITQHSLQTLSNIPSLDSDSAQSTKTDPTEQNSIPYMVGNV